MLLFRCRFVAEICEGNVRLLLILTNLCRLVVYSAPLEIEVSGRPVFQSRGLGTSSVFFF